MVFFSRAFQIILSGKARFHVLIVMIIYYLTAELLPFSSIN